MRLKLLLFVLLLSGMTLQMEAQPGGGEQFLFGSSEPEHMIINNRILANVNDKPISVIDVMKKMDSLFYRQYPQYAKSVPARFQYYQLHWKHVLQELIDKELIMADAAEGKLEVSDGDVRQEMEALFGPNVIENLDNANLTFDEAWDIVKSEIILRRMMFFRVNAKAMKQVTPQKIKEAYETYVAENSRPDTWNYYVITIRGPQPKKNEDLARLSHKLLSSEGVPLSSLSDELKALNALDPETKVTISDRYQHHDQEVSEAYRSSLAPLESGQYSHPVAQQSRADNSTVYRIFYLENIETGGSDPFEEVAHRLEDELLMQAAGKESVKYINKLRRHYNFHEEDLALLIPEDFEPFEVH